MNEATLAAINAIKASGQNTFNTMEKLTSITGQVIVRSFFGDDLANVKWNGKEPHVEISLLISDGVEATMFNPIGMLKHWILG